MLQILLRLNCCCIKLMLKLLLIFRNILWQKQTMKYNFGCFFPVVLLWGFHFTSYLGAGKFLKRERVIKETESTNTSLEIHQAVYLTSVQMVTGAVLTFFLFAIVR